MSTPTFNPMQVTNASGLFVLQTQGFVQGNMEPDPAALYQIASGIVSTAETNAMYAGIAVYNNIPVSTSGVVLGGTLGRAATAAAITGFTVANLAYNGIVNPSGNAPYYLPSMTMNYVPLGSNARVPVSISPALATSLSNGTTSITTQASWDVTAQQLVPYTPTYTTVTITGAVWANTAGGQTTFTVGTNLTAVLSAGSIIEVAGVVNTGGTSTSAFNGQFTVVSTSSTTVVVTQVAANSPGTYASGGTILPGGGAVPCQIVKVNIGNSMSIYLDVNGVPQWNRSGSCAIIKI